MNPHSSLLLLAPDSRDLEPRARQAVEDALGSGSSAKVHPLPGEPFAAAYGERPEAAP